MNDPGRDPTDRTIFPSAYLRSSLRPAPRPSASILAAGLAFLCLCALIGCAPAPKFRAHAEVHAPAAGESSSGGGGISEIGIRLSPPVRDFGAGRITSHFGMRPSSGRRHDGVDIKARPGEEILAAASGIVEFSGRKSGYGNVVILDHGNGVGTLYAHLFYACVRAGESIGAGETLGRAGKRGRATGTHLHFEVRLRGSPIDPVPHLWLDSAGK